METVIEVSGSKPKNSEATRVVIEQASESVTQPSQVAQAERPVLSEPKSSELTCLLAKLGRVSVHEISERDLAILVGDVFGETVRFNCQTGYWVRYVPKSGKWLSNETHYMAHNANRIGELFRRVARTDISKGDRSVLLGLAKRIESWKGIGSVLSFLSANPDARVSTAEFDIKPAILGVANGAFDIERGLFFQPEPDDFLTKSCAADFNPFADFPAWRTVLDHIVAILPEGERQPMLDFLQCVAGEMLIHRSGRRRFYFFGGPPGTGKSIFTNTMNELLGTYAVALAPDVLMTSKTSSSAPRPELMQLPGARMLLLSEAGDGQCFDDDRIKAYTGADPITARNLYEATVTFPVGALICLTGNSYPSSKTGGSAFMSRICIINFTNQVTPDRQDVELPLKLRSELSGILNWALVGAMKVLRGDRAPWPVSVTRDTQRYRDSSDPVRMFVEECCRRVPGARTPKARLHAAYAEWCRENGYSSLQAIRFSTRVVDLGFNGDVRENNLRCFGDIELISLLTQQRPWSGTGVSGTGGEGPEYRL